jgi:type IV pilus assembly protein PilW
MKTKKKNDKGFTILELLIAMFISMIVMTGIWKTFSFQQRSYFLQRQIVAMEQNLRAGLLLMESEIRMAGFDPNGIADAGIMTAGANSIRFTMDINNDSDTYSFDGDTNDTNEDITYALYTATDGVQKLGRASPSTGQQPVAEYINSLSFVYKDADGNDTTNPTAVRSVEITLQARTARTSPTRYAELTTLINCRNIGL